MLSFFDGFRDINSATILFRMVFAILCGGAIGIERSIKNRPAGFRTHVLIIIGATTASLTGHFIYLNMSLPTDMSRLGAQVITGLGFIGAGTIIVTGQRTVLARSRSCSQRSSSEKSRSDASNPSAALSITCTKTLWIISSASARTRASPSRGSRSRARRTIPAAMCTPLSSLSSPIKRSITSNSHKSWRLSMM